MKIRLSRGKEGLDILCSPCYLLTKPFYYSIVFSQFVNFLDLVYWRLSRAGFECIRLDGTMTPGQRDAAIQQ